MLKNILLIAREEYLTRVTKKAFIVMTLLAPIIFVGFYAAVIGVAISESKQKTEKTYIIIDSGNLLNGTLENSELNTFTFTNNFETAKNQLNDETIYGIISLTIKPDSPKDNMELLTLDYPSVNQKQWLESKINSRVSEVNLAKLGIAQGSLDSIYREVNLQTSVLNANQIEDSSSEFRSVIGMVLAFVIYMFIFLYGVQVMKGVNEEKTNRIVEIVISTVRPFELMMGKIWGIAGVALTQFVAWIALSGILTLVLGLFFASNMDSSMVGSAAGGIEQTGGGEVTAMLQEAFNLPIGSIILSFVFYFLGGYLVYASLFAAVAAAVDSDSDYQQFMMPITLPLIFAIMIATTSVINNPDSTLSVATSIIPLTSPIVMMVRIPFGVPAWEIIASIIALIGFFLVAVWGAGKIYQTGILLHGKKIGYKDMVKWIFKKKE